MKKFNSRLLLSALLALGCLSGCSEEQAEKKIRIGVSVPAATHGWAGGVGWSAEKAKKEIEAANPDVEIILTTAHTTTEQVDRIENLLARKLDALVVLCQEPGPITAVSKKAVERGIYLTVANNRFTEPLENLFVDGDNRSFGRQAAEAMGQLLGGKGEIVVMEGIPCPVNTDRIVTFREVLAEKYPEIKILESQSAWWNTEKGMNLMETYLQKYPKIDALWAGDDDVLIGALQAYRNSKRTDIKAMIGGGGSKIIVKEILDDKSAVKATVTYPPGIIEVAMHKTLENLRAGKTEKEEIIIESVIVTKENAEQYYFPDSVY